MSKSINQVNYILLNIKNEILKKLIDKNQKSRLIKTVAKKIEGTDILVLLTEGV